MYKYLIDIAVKAEFEQVNSQLRTYVRHTLICKDLRKQ